MLLWYFMDVAVKLFAYYLRLYAYYCETLCILL
jgi:hypothetical protein